LPGRNRILLATRTCCNLDAGPAPIWDDEQLRMGGGHRQALDVREIDEKPPFTKKTKELRGIYRPTTDDRRKPVERSTSSL